MEAGDKIFFEGKVEYIFSWADPLESRLRIQIPDNSLCKKYFKDWFRTQEKRARAKSDFNSITRTEIRATLKNRVFKLYHSISPDTENIDNGKETNGLIEWYFKFGFKMGE